MGGQLRDYFLRLESESGLPKGKRVDYLNLDWTQGIILPQFQGIVSILQWHSEQVSLWIHKVSETWRHFTAGLQFPIISSAVLSIKPIKAKKKKISTSFIVIMLLYKGLTQAHSQQKPRLHFGESFALSEHQSKA